MTVAAVILFARPEAAIADAAGRPAARRIVESAWAGGATPIVVVASDTDGRLATALAGSPAVLAEPVPAGGPLAQVKHGVELAAREVRGTDAALIWPGRMTWVDAETVTTLIEAHGSDPHNLLAPSFDGTTGLPVLLPLDQLGALEPIAPGEPPDDVLLDIRSTSIPRRSIDVGDPGVTHDIGHDLDALPPYAGPPEPAHAAPEWGAAAAEMPDESPLTGPALAPYGQAADPESD